jgi:cell division transport system permease protein
LLRGAQIGYLARESLAGFRRRKLTTGVTVLIMASALLVLALFTIATINLGALLESARSGIDLRVFLVNDVTEESLTETQAGLLAMPGVARVVYVSKEEALREFQRELGEDADLLSTLESNPLPASFHLQLDPAARSPATVRQLSKEITTWPNVADVIYGQGWLEVLERWTFHFRLASLLVGLVVFVAAVFVISNTVKLTVASSERVIEIMKLVGATNSFIRTPFLCEGVLEGLLGGVVAMAVLCGAYALLRPHITGLIFFSPLQMGGFIGLCVILGLLGSWAAMRKYLRL